MGWHEGRKGEAEGEIGKREERGRLNWWKGRKGRRIDSENKARR